MWLTEVEGTGGWQPVNKGELPPSCRWALSQFLGGHNWPMWRCFDIGFRCSVGQSQNMQFQDSSYVQTCEATTEEGFVVSVALFHSVLATRGEETGWQACLKCCPTCFCGKALTLRRKGLRCGRCLLCVAVSF